MKLHPPARLVTLGILALALTFAGCASCPTSCDELKAAADGKHCPERLVETTITKFERVDVGDVPGAPPITTATLPDGATVAQALQRLAADLKAARAWGWTLYHKLEALERADDDTE